MTDIEKLSPELEKKAKTLIDDYRKADAEIYKAETENRKELNAAYDKAKRRLNSRIREISDISEGADVLVVTLESVSSAPLKVHCSKVELDVDGIIARDESSALTLKAELAVCTKDGRVSKNSHKLNLTDIVSVNGNPCTNGYCEGTEALQKELLDEFLATIYPFSDVRDGLDAQHTALCKKLKEGLAELAKDAPVKVGHRYRATVRETITGGILCTSKEAEDVTLLCRKVETTNDEFDIRFYYLFDVYATRFLSGETIETRKLKYGYQLYHNILNIEEI